jgi:hypothetical protein
VKKRRKCFIKTFYKFNVVKSEIFSAYEYRRFIIKRIKEKYSIEEFYKYEKIMNKLYWNLYHKLHKNDKLCNMMTDPPKIFQKSFNNKILSYNYKTKMYHVQRDYIDNETRKKNKTEIKIMSAMMDMNLYLSFYKNPEKKIKKMDVFYYPLDYPFPNVNRCFYNENPSKEWINRIKKMYFYYNDDYIDKYWYEFITPIS